MEKFTFKITKILVQLDSRKNKTLEQLEKLENKPKSQGEKKGQLMENLRLSDIEKVENQKYIDEASKKIKEIQTELSQVEGKLNRNKRKKKQVQLLLLKGLIKEDLIYLIELIMNFN